MQSISRLERHGAREKLKLYLLIWYGKPLNSYPTREIPTFCHSIFAMMQTL